MVFCLAKFFEVKNVEEKLFYSTDTRLPAIMPRSGMGFYIMDLFEVAGIN